MRAACDTNIWLRGLFRPSSYPGRVIDAWLDGRFVPVTSDPLIEIVTAYDFVQMLDALP